MSADLLRRAETVLRQSAANLPASIANHPWTATRVEIRTTNSDWVATTHYATTTIHNDQTIAEHIALTATPTVTETIANLLNAAAKYWDDSQTGPDDIDDMTRAAIEAARAVLREGEATSRG